MGPAIVPPAPDQHNPGSVRRGGRPKDQNLRDHLWLITRQAQPCTVRQVFYLAMVRGLVPKLETGYAKVQRLLVEMRLADELPWEWLADNTRWSRKPASYTNLAEATDWWSAGYRRSLIPALGHVEIWLEKDALAGVIYPVTAEWDVPLMVTRGFASLSFLHGAAMAMDDYETATFYYLGDHDPSGTSIDANVERRLRQWRPDVDLNFKRIAVTETQIADWNLPSRPTKQTDTRIKSWTGGESVELDAIEPETLRGLVRDAIESHVDPDVYARIRTVEAAERQSINDFGLRVSKTRPTNPTDETGA